MWSKKPIPVETFDTPLPSRSTTTSMSVSLVVRLIDAVRPLAVAASARPGFFAVTLRARAMGIAFRFDFAPFYQGFPGFATARGSRVPLDFP
jgi:hypothetical protein